MTAVTAALAGCATVTALDITTAAVENTRANAELHGVADRVRVAHSDLFEALEPGERFDLIFWNSNYIEVEPERGQRDGASPRAVRPRLRDAPPVPRAKRRST